MAAEGAPALPDDARAHFRRFDRSRLTASRRSMVVAAVVILLVLAPTGVIAWSVARGAFFAEAPSTTHAPRGHVVRTHGWGGYYIGMGAGRTHFGGGGRIH